MGVGVGVISLFLGYWNLNMPESFLDMFCSQPLVGASSSSLSKSWKYVGWLSGCSISPLRGNYHVVRARRLRDSVRGQAYLLLEPVIGQGVQGIRLLELLELVDNGRFGIPPLDASRNDFVELGLGAEVVLGPQGQGAADVLVRLLWEGGVLAAGRDRSRAGAGHWEGGTEGGTYAC